MGLQRVVLELLAMRCKKRSSYLAPRTPTEDVLVAYVPSQLRPLQYEPPLLPISEPVPVPLVEPPHFHLRRLLLLLHESLRAVVYFLADLRRA